MNTYKTSELARLAGIHPNTVRLYEELRLIPKPARESNGYRVFTELHVEQIKLVRLALQVELVQNGLRKQAIRIIKTSASGDFGKAISLTEQYLQQINEEQFRAEEAISIVKKLLSGKNDAQAADNMMALTRKEAADLMQISMDALRNWELNGLLTVTRKHNGYRMYTNDDIRRLKIIRCLRFANYSLASILRMLNTLSLNPDADIREIINTPGESDDIISVCDKLLTSLQNAEQNALTMLTRLEFMNKNFSANPPL
ncbi:MerR family transcriptional regulator [Paenibacillus antibioticophila]|uniref:MerR family transcriptional regulator n=1 Tax=Paenibacillus antibioticophila TaxID=1274374 RepID=A0A919XSN2_9BACL|nr:MerR family transcriptional regulator [Paenibacillus antibioticophila]GIO36833.1 MerR family transcriptional regulator [Paenibacillus antibioticophila]